MKDFIKRKLKNRGETIVEVMVAFVVLLIVLALFGTSIVATGNAEKYANEKRAEAEDAMQLLQKKLHGGETESVTAGGETESVTAGAEKTSVLQSKNLVATQYTTTDGFVYWVFTNEE